MQYLHIDGIHVERVAQHTFDLGCGKLDERLLIFRGQRLDRESYHAKGWAVFQLIHSRQGSFIRLQPFMDQPVYEQDDTDLDDLMPTSRELETTISRK